MKYEILFFGMPRVASTSLIAALEGKVDIVGHAELDVARSIIRRYKTSFCFVRNPIDRFLSAYIYHKFNKSPHLKDQETTKYMGKYRSPDEMALDIHNFIRECPFTVHYIPQSRWVYDRGEKIVTHVLSYERLEEDFDFICKKLGISAVLGERRWNNSVKEKPQLSREARECLFKFYRDDFNNFGYKEES